ncbi:ricin-type beta-trefoil lectin domain protein [Streptomyces sp. HUAS ZL42]|uniref:ricin-type beta-trefoil lectin domain protein n=1 Tax=Streptomyces sp. HUAS ZL42 TaxID=3231715 RepID=UPI00345EE3B3
MKDAGLSNSPTPAPRFDATDEQLSAELKKWTGASPALHPVGELLDRHWEAAFAYARLCTDSARAAGMLTTAAFTRLFGASLRQNGPSSAWRPQLLVTVRRIAAEWDADGRRDLLHPALRADDGGSRAAARLLPTSYGLLARAFQRLPQSARCVLWHIEVESEPLEVPAALLGWEEDTRVELDRARERLREECLVVHRELAPDQECRRYHRMLDVTYRRGGIDIDPDLRTHLEQCGHCRQTADQLQQFDEGLGVALAEGVLGWGARAYVEARAHQDDESPDGAEFQLPAFAGEAFEARATRSNCRTHSRRSAQKRARRARRRNLAAAVLTVSGLIVLPLALWTLGSGDGDSTADGKTSEAPGSGSGKSTGDPSWIGTGEGAKGTLSGRLHNVVSGLCVGVVGDKAVEGAETKLTACSSAADQQWSYETDGLLRSDEDPALCLDSRLGYSVRLAPCVDADHPDAKNVRYDFTLQGTLVPRFDQNLALAPAATDGSGALVLKARADGTPQRWVIDTSKPNLRMQIVNWGTDSGLASTTSSVKPTPKAAHKPTPTPSATRTTAQPAPTSSPSTADPCAQNPYYCSWNGQYGGSGGYGYGYGYGGYGGYGYGRR